MEKPGDKIIGVKLDEPKLYLNTLGDCWESVWAEDDNLYSVIFN